MLTNQCHQAQARTEAPHSCSWQIHLNIKLLWISHQASKTSKTFLMSMASVTYVSPPMLKDTQVKAKGSNLPFTSCSASSLSVVVGLKRKKIKKINKYFSLTIQSPHRPGEQSGQAVAFIPFFPHSYLFSCWKTMWGKASVHCLGEMQSLTSLLAVQQCTLQQPVMCRLLPYICTIFFLFFFPTPESTWCIKMVEHCLNSTQFHFKKCMLCF